MKRLRVYLDASVVGGCIDEEFREESRSLLDMARRGEAVLLISDLLAEELENAPQEVQNQLASLPEQNLEPVTRGPESDRLRDAYLAAGVLA